MEFESQKKINEYIGNNNLLDILISNLLKKSIQNSIILYGNQGIGKSTFVYYLCKILFNKINGNNVSQNFNLNDYHDSRLISNSIHPNLYVVNPIYDSKTNKYKSEININQIRELDKFIYMTSTNNLPKIILIDSADQLNKNASNALLKVLEEPTNNTYFFLISHHLSNLYPTIRSRCSKYKLFNPNFIDFEKIIKLYCNHDTDKTNFNILYKITHSSPGLALNFIENDFDYLQDKIIELLLNKHLLNNDLIDFSITLSKNEVQFYIFIYLIKYILISSIKFIIGLSDKDHDSLFLNNIKNIIKFISIYKMFDMLDFINTNEKNINIYNLDKKLFIIKFFSYAYKY